MPFSAAHATKRPTMSPLTGREPTRKRPRRAIPRGVETRALIARIRSQGLSTRRRTVASKTPPPETSRHANPAPSRTSATRSTSAVGSLPARGSCESRRMVVSTSLGTTLDLSGGVGKRSGPRDVAAFAWVDLDLLARVDEERHLDDGARLEGRGLRHVRDRVAADGRLGLRDRQLDGGRELDAGRLAVDLEHLDGARRR